MLKSRSTGVSDKILPDIPQDKKKKRNVMLHK